MTITIEGSNIVTEEPLPAETTTDEASLTTLISSEEVSAKVEVTERPAAGSEEVSETIEVVTQLPAGLVPQTTEAAVGDAVTEFEEDQITTDSPHSVTSVAESGPIETLEKAVKPVNLPAAAENPVETGNTFTTVANPPRETESATEAVVNILQDVNGDDDAAATVSTETTMDTTISSENIAVEGGEKSDVIQGGSGGESKLVDLVTGSNLGQVSTTLTPPQEQPVTFFPSEEEEGTTDQINNEITDSDTPSSELLSEELVIASNEIPDAAAPKLDESDASESLGEVESVTELVTVESETKKSSRREGGRSQALQAADSQNLIQFVDEKSTNIENLDQKVSKKEETTHSPASPTDKLSNKRIIFPDDADDQPFEITFSTQLPVEATTSGVVIEASNTSTLSAENDPIDCISGLVCGGRCLATHQVCDSLVDCENGEDEAECGFPSCREDEFSCLKGRCIPDAWKCDGKPDCSEGEDEVACSTSCPAGQMLCGEGRCLEERFVCDGTEDCGQGEDEANCTCGADQFQCQWGGGCVGQQLRCNGKFDCVDRSDELGCREVKAPEWGDWSLSEDHMKWLIKGDRQEDSGIQWPTISLLFNMEAASSCTVSILSPEWLATSHSCLASASLDPLSWVLFGGPAGGDLAVNGTQIKTVQDIVSHPQTRRSQHLFSNDLALVRLEEPLEFNDEVSSICVAAKIPDSDQLCVTAGWTAGEEAGVTYSQYLNYLPQPVVPDLTCNSTSMYSGKLTHDSFCSRADGDSKLCQVWMKILFLVQLFNGSLFQEDK